MPGDGTTPMLDYPAQDWRTKCHAKGGVPTVDPTSGADACRLPDTSSSTGWRYENPGKGISDLIADWEHTASTTLDDWEGQFGTAFQNAADLTGLKTAGSAVQVAEENLGVTGLGAGLEDGATGLVAKGLGIPHWLFVVLLIVALYMLGVGAGILPPLKKLL